jgi:hypothetical protein
LNAELLETLAITAVRDAILQPTLDLIARRYGGRLRQRLGWMADNKREVAI